MQLKLKLHQLWRIALWLSRLQLSVFLKGANYKDNLSLLTGARISFLGNTFWIKLNSVWTVLLLRLCDRARPWFRFSTRTSLTSCRVGFVLSCFYKSNFSCSLSLARAVQSWNSIDLPDPVGKTPITPANNILAFQDRFETLYLKRFEIYRYSGKFRPVEALRKTLVYPQSSMFCLSYVIAC